MKREKILAALGLQVRMGHHITGVATGSGMVAKSARDGGADFLLALNSGRFRQMGRSSLAGFLPFCNSNDMVMDFASREIVPLMTDIPVVFGLNATDPTKRDMDHYIDEIKNMGFSGLNNYPTVGLIDGSFREALESDGYCYRLEAEAIRRARQKDLFTIAFVFDEEQARQMIEAGADIICVHLGFTAGGLLGAKKVLSLEAAKRKTEEIFRVCNSLRPDVIKLIYGGPVKTPVDVEYMYASNKDLMGYIGGSSFERIPAEQSITGITKAFKVSGDPEEDSLLQKMLQGVHKHYDYAEFVVEYVARNYMHEISFLELALAMHLSRSYLSALFKKEVGCGFPAYLVRFRVNKAIEILNENDIQLSEVASMVGYADYAQFCKMFKKYAGCSPGQYKKRNINTKRDDIKQCTRGKTDSIVEV